MKFLLWNLQDFFLFLDKYDQSSSTTTLENFEEAHWQLLTASLKSNKPLHKVLAIRDLIQLEDPEILLFTEVGGKESLDNFNQYFLNSSYRVIHYATNSDRGIDLGILIKPSVKIRGDKMNKQKAFARGALEILLETSIGEVSLFLTHLKSKLNMDGADFEGRSKRAREVAELIKLAKKRMAQNKEVIICGDFNGVIYADNSEPELQDFANILGLKDCLEHLQVPYFERASYIYYNRRGEGFPMQLDYFIISDQLAERLNAETRILDFQGGERTIFPKNIKEKNEHPSDHYPIKIKLDI